VTLGQIGNRNTGAWREAWRNLKDVDITEVLRPEVSSSNPHPLFASTRNQRIGSTERITLLGAGHLSDVDVDMLKQVEFADATPKIPIT